MQGRALRLFTDNAQFGDGGPGLAVHFRENSYPHIAASYFRAFGVLGFFRFAEGRLCNRFAEFIGRIADVEFAVLQRAVPSGILPSQVAEAANRVFGAEVNHQFVRVFA